MNKELIILPLVLIVVIFVAGCIGQSPTGEVVKEVPGEVRPIVTEELKLEIGESARTSKIQVTVLEVKKTDYYTYYSDILEQTMVERANPGEVFILVDAEIKNINISREYAGSNKFSITDSAGFRYEPEILYYGENPLPTFKELYPNERIKGKILFKIPETATGLKVIYDFAYFFEPVKLASWRIPETSIERLATKRSATIKIENVGTSWYEFLNYGTITEIDYYITNTGSVPIDPTFDVKITYGGREVYSKTDATSLFYGNIEAGKSVKNEISLYVSELLSGSYTVKVDLRDGSDATILSTDTKTITIG